MPLLNQTYDQMQTIQRSRLQLGLGIAAVAVALAYSWVAGGLRPFTQPANISVALPVAAVLVLVCLRRPRRREAGTARIGRNAVIVWVALLIALVAWELVAYRSSPRDDHPTLSSIADSIMSTHPGRAAMFLGWLAAGAALAFLPRDRA
jgi:hypothetical protein